MSEVASTWPLNPGQRVLVLDERLRFGRIMSVMGVPLSVDPLAGRTFAVMIDGRLRRLPASALVPAHPEEST